MSLLMDALRKAEEAKRQTERGDPPELTLAPLTPRQAAATSALPDLDEHSAAIDAGLSAVANEALRCRAGSSATAAANSGEREAAARSAVRNVFAAKTSARRRSGAWTLVAAVTGGAALAIGAYFWWQLSLLSNPARQPPALPPSSPPMAAPQPTPLPPVSPAPPETASTSTPPPAVPAGAKAPATPFADSARAAEVAPAPEVRQRPTRTTPAAAPANDNALRLRKSPPARGNMLENAYDALQAGRLDEAQRGYEQALRADPYSTDALLGLATIATRQGRAEAAQDYYRRALEADPSDATAQAGLINARGQSDPQAAESRLKNALDAQPDSSALLFALGNLYARQARWSEAQQAYFRAYAAEPDNADIIFNLAVALDHLRQNRLAAQYYQMALSAARDGQRSVLFDRQQVSARIQELQP